MDTFSSLSRRNFLVVGSAATAMTALQMTGDISTAAERAADQTEPGRALAALETAYQWGASGLVTFVAYGIPYFNRLNQFVVAAALVERAAAFVERRLRLSIDGCTSRLAAALVERRPRLEVGG